MYQSDVALRWSTVVRAFVSCVSLSTRKPPVEAALIPVTTPSQPLCAEETRASVRLSVCSWLADHVHFDHAHRHRPSGQPVSITGQPAGAAATVTDTTDNLVVLITV